MTKTEEEEDVLESIYCRIEEIQRVHDPRNFQPRKPKLHKLSRKVQEDNSRRLYYDSIKERKERIESKREEWRIAREGAARRRKIPKDSLHAMVSRLYTPSTPASSMMGQLPSPPPVTETSDEDVDLLASSVALPRTETNDSQTLLPEPRKKAAPLGTLSTSLRSTPPKRTNRPPAVAAPPPVVVPPPVAAAPSSPSPAPSPTANSPGPSGDGSDSPSPHLPACGSGISNTGGHQNWGRSTSSSNILQDSNNNLNTNSQYLNSSRVSTVRSASPAASTLPATPATNRQTVSSRSQRLRLPSPASDANTFAMGSVRAKTPEYEADADPHLFWYRKRIQKANQERRVQAVQERRRLQRELANKKPNPANKNNVTVWHRKEMTKKEELHRRIIVRMQESDARREIATMMQDERDALGLHPPPISKRKAKNLPTVSTSDSGSSHSKTRSNSQQHVASPSAKSTASTVSVESRSPSFSTSSKDSQSSRASSRLSSLSSKSGGEQDSSDDEYSDKSYASSSPSYSTSDDDTDESD
eukprot:TRINITY_DN16395_c0_g1_i1.p1 TRINITY_DN16395_c0_g1~~TRINITY_DN16395_c0_g1_i1.p1  ORF type:complete len:529 (-),score=36.17 TRINITY_DN16395_c0_g1_i1:75-1661(-)